jgi:RNA recognition motif-containing protein
MLTGLSKKGDIMNIYIGNLSLETTEAELRAEFTKFGEVISVTIMNDRYIGSGQPRAYGYIQMISKEQGANAIAGIEGKVLHERVITAVEALPLTKYTKSIPGTPVKKRSYKNRERKSAAKSDPGA